MQVKQKKALCIIIGIAIASLAFWQANALWNLFGPVLLAALMAYLLFPIVSWFEKKLSRLWAAIVMYLLILIILAGMIYFVVPRLIDEIIQLMSTMPKLFELGEQAIVWIEDVLRNIQVEIDLKLWLQQQAEYLLPELQKALGQIASGIFSKLSWFVFVPFVAFFLLFDRQYFLQQIFFLIPSKYRNSVKQTGAEIDKLMRNYIRGQFILCLVSAALNMAGFLIVGAPYALLFGFLLGIFNIIPYFGPVIAAVPVLLLSLQGGTSTFLSVLIVIIIVQQLLGIYFAPKIIGDSVDVHPVYVLVSLTIGTFFLGLWGMIISVPIMLVIRSIIKTIYRRSIEKQVEII